MSRSLSRRGFLRLGAGAASLAVVSGLGIIGPRKAHAVIGIDDAALGGLVLLVATLGGYTLSRTVANVSLGSLGYGFSDFVSDSSNQAAAVTQAIADANNLGVELNRSNAESAAQSIAAGTGYFAEVMGNAATSGRVALDNFISGAGELPGVLRTLVGNFVSSKLGQQQTMLDGCVSADGVTAGTTGQPYQYDNLSANKYLKTASDIGVDAGVTIPSGYWAIQCNLYWTSNGRKFSQTTVYGDSPIRLTNEGAYRLIVNANNAFTYVDEIVGSTPTTSTASSINLGPTSTTQFTPEFTFSGNMVTGGALPVVDRAADAPDVIGPGYDSLPLANDLVIDPSTDEVVSAGSLPLPTSIPDVWGDYVGTLNDILAGVIPGQISLPVSVAEPVVVGTAEGVQSMSITDAIAGDTSLSAAINPPVDPYPPYDPVEPPVDVPEGPWTPAVSLPFERIWPFNMIFSFIELFEQLGGS